VRAERRAQRKKRLHPADWATRKGLDRVDPHPVERVELFAELKAVLGGIEEQWRQPIVLHFFEGLTQGQVAARLGVTQQSVSQRIRAGLDLIRVRIT
jgi:RNA polymerase sigma factor (sigma-70 family)